MIARGSDATHEAPNGSEVAPLPTSLRQLKEMAAGCRRCPLYRNATQVVCGEGPAHAPVVFVGEVPGDQEDIAGRPFVGPAGKLLDRALADAGIERRQIYVTNAVKHFKFEQRGKRRLHKRPDAYEIGRCRWWLDNELALIKPQLTVALGATAARALAGRVVTISRLRGAILKWRDGLRGFVTVHPSALLRMPDPGDKEREYRHFVGDLAAIAREVPEIRV